MPFCQNLYPTFFYFCHNFLLFFIVSFSRFLANFPVAISCPLFLLLSQFFALFLLCLCHRFLANFPTFLALYFNYWYNFLLFLYCISVTIPCDSHRLYWKLQNISSFDGFRKKNELHKFKKQRPK